MPVDAVVAGAVGGSRMRRTIRNARFIGRFQLPAPVESCLWRDEITALREIVAARDAGHRHRARYRRESARVVSGALLDDLRGARGEGHGDGARRAPAGDSGERLRVGYFNDKQCSYWRKTMKDFEAWDRWAASLKPGDRCLVAGREATVTAKTDEFLWARMNGRTDAEPWDWESVEPVRAA